eukprot:SAG31_NODE_13870_length_841_cov_0.997305_2_plen_63_part_00
MDILDSTATKFSVLNLVRKYPDFPVVLNLVVQVKSDSMSDSRPDAAIGVLGTSCTRLCDNSS